MAMLNILINSHPQSGWAWIAHSAHFQACSSLKKWTAMRWDTITPSFTFRFKTSLDRKQLS